VSETVWTWRIHNRLTSHNRLTIWTVGDGHFVWNGKAYLNDGKPYPSLQEARRAADRATPAHRYEVTPGDRGWACGSLTLSLQLEGECGDQRLVAFLFEGNRFLDSKCVRCEYEGIAWLKETANAKIKTPVTDNFVLT
jgi:hypothetical protein